jgi:hypothetical protein
MTLRMRHINRPQCHTLFGEMTNLTTIVAGAGHSAHLLWRWAWHGRWGHHSSRHDILMLRWTGSQVMMLRLWVVMWSTYDPILVRSTVRWECHSLVMCLGVQL